MTSLSRSSIITKVLFRGRQKGQSQRRGHVYRSSGQSDAAAGREPRIKNMDELQTLEETTDGVLQ